MADASAWWKSLVAEYEEKHRGEKIEELLGQGNSAAVFRLSSPLGSAALKIYKPQFLEGPNEAAERHRLSLHERLRDHSCPSLVRIYAVGELSDSAFITMEYVPWPSLDSVLGAVPTASIPALIGDVARAVQWMQVNSLAHRDIKPANILISPDFSRAKLVDFGVVCSTDDTSPDLTDHGHRRPFVATAQYSSPEYLFRLVEPSDQLWLGLSVYQVGAVLHDMVEKRALFSSEVLTENRYVLAMAVLQRQPPFYGRDYPVAWGALARRALTKDLAVRLRAVNLDQFTKLGVFDASAARRRLGLGDSQPIGISQSVGRETERKLIQLRKVRDDLEEKLKHQLRTEGYSRVRWLQQDGDSVWLIVQVPNFDGFCVSFRLQALLLQENVQLLAGVSLVADALTPVLCRSALWEGALDQVGAALADEVVPLVSELLLMALSKASDIVTLGRDQDVPVTLLEGA